MNSLVSVVIPCYNCEKYIRKCLDALLSQTYKKIEVIVINDGSKDETFNILESYKGKFKEKNIIYKIVNQENMGQASAVNNGLKLCTGKYLMWQDSDDWYENDAIELLLNKIETSNYKLARGECAYREEDDIDNIKFVAKSKDQRDKCVFDNYIFETDSYCFPGIFIVEMDYFDKCVKNRSIYTSKGGQNWQLILPVAYNNICGYLNKVVYNYRVRSDSHSHIVITKKEQIKRCNIHKDILFNVIKEISNMPNYKKIIYYIKIWYKYFNKKTKLYLKK